MLLHLVLRIKQIYGGIGSYRALASYRNPSCSYLASCFSVNSNWVRYVNPLLLISHIKLWNEKVSLVENECG